MEWEVLWRVAVAAGLATAIGVEREAAGQPAGLRTHVSVALGACLFGVVSTLGFDEYVARRETTNVQVDVTRVASNVVVGIGFMGAGLIFREGGRVRNLTTAASVWSTAAIGLAAGVGSFGAALVTTVALVATLVLLRPVRAVIVRTFVRDRRRLTILLRRDASPDAVLAALRDAPGVRVETPTVGKEGGAPVIRARAVARPGADLGPVISDLAARPEVESLSDLADE